MIASVNGKVTDYKSATSGYIDDFGFIFTLYKKFNLEDFSKDELKHKVEEIKFHVTILSEISNIENESQFEECKEIFLYELQELFEEEPFMMSYFPYLNSTKDIAKYFFVRPYYKFSRRSIDALGDNSFIKKIYTNQYNLSSEGQSSFIDDFYELRETYLLDDIEKENFMSELKSINRDFLKIDNKNNIAVIREL